jgi:hypothetical protein
MARELGPNGIHIGHVIVNGQIESERYRHLIDERGEDSLLAPDATAELYLQVAITTAKPFLICCRQSQDCILPHGSWKYCVVHHNKYGSQVQDG